MAYAANKCGSGYKNINGKFEHCMFYEYVADSFEELPVEEEVQIGDKAIFNDNGSLGIAIYFTTGWVKG